MSTPIESPCTRKCLSNGKMCVSCGRTHKEIRMWSRADRETRQRIVEDAKSRVKKVNPNN